MEYLKFTTRYVYGDFFLASGKKFLRLVRLTAKESRGEKQPAILCVLAII